jgi:oxygen-independent coproporphyrinogen-3 oxidase
LGWYEVSNWGTPCRHNLAYWQGGDWWGAGPGAHSHVGGVRWWNVKHPAAYTQRLAEGRSPALAREVLTDEDRRRVDAIIPPGTKPIAAGTTTSGEAKLELPGNVRGATVAITKERGRVDAPTSDPILFTVVQS